MKVLTNVNMQDMAFLGSKISNNIAKTPEGFLIAYNVPIARLGLQRYKGQEVHRNFEPNKIINIYRLPGDVFDVKAMASGEGKPFTDEHPSQFPVQPSNVATYIKGHVQNIRRNKNHLECDIIINDSTAINLVENDIKREISAGYTCDWVPYKDGYKQINIRINHVALVSKGRAGPQVAIKDSGELLIKRSNYKMDKKQAIDMLLHNYAKDSTPEEFSEMKTALDGMLEEELKITEPIGEVKGTKDKAFLDTIMAILKPEKKKVEQKDEIGDRLTAIETALLALAATDAKSEKEDEVDCKDKDKELMAALDDSEVEDENMHIEEEKKEHLDNAYLQIARDLKPILAGMPEKYRKPIKDVLLESKRTASTGAYIGIQKAVTSHAKATVTDNEPKNLGNIGAAINKAWNPHQESNVKKVDFN